MTNLCHCQSQYVQTRERWFISWSLLPRTEFCWFPPSWTGATLLCLHVFLVWDLWNSAWSAQSFLWAFLPSVCRCVQDNVLVSEHIPSFSFRYKLYYRWESVFLDSQYRHTSFHCALFLGVSQILWGCFGCCFFCFVLTDWRFVATLHWASLLVSFFQNIFLLCVSLSHFGDSQNLF